MKDKLKVDLVSDVVCPWCIIGYKRLAQAISDLGIQDMTELVWQPFELNPEMPAGGEDVRTYSARKYGTTPEDGIRSRANMTKLGAELGFTFDFFEGMKIVNTRDAHVLLDYAKTVGKQTELQLRLFDAFFGERKDVSDRQVLIQAMETVGLNVEDGLRQLDDTAARERVKTQEAYWRSLGISAVPTAVINHASALTGAQPVDVYKQTFAALIDRMENPSAT